MPNTPKPFTDAQRELFGAVAMLNRAKANTFSEADRWIDTPPPTAQARYEHFRDACLVEARERRTRRDRSHGIELSRSETGYGIVTYRRQRWQQMPNKQRQQLLWDARSLYGRNLRYQRQQWAERIQEEAAHGPLQPHERIDLAASRFRKTSDPPVFDAMNPPQKAMWARRLLRVVWILTDTADLTATELPWLREWRWGEHTLEFLGDWRDGDVRPVPRLWLRVTTFDGEIDEWERLTRDALRALDEAEPGAAAVPAPAKCAAPASNQLEQQIQVGIEAPRTYIDLDQAAALVNRSKRTLERRLGDMPMPVVQGMGGKKSEWLYAELRPWLETEYGKMLPDRPPHAIR
jgi:hypothetical protein